MTGVFGAQGRKAFEVNPAPGSTPTMPIEFSVAAFRLGHSMIRHNYEWNKVFRTGSALRHRLARPALPVLAQEWRHGRPAPEHLDRGLPPALQAQPDEPGADVPDGGLGVTPAQFNMAVKIDTRLANPLATLPIPDPSPENNLAFRNLLRANMVKLATGQQMVTFLRGKGVTLTKLTAAQIRNGNGGASLAGLNADAANRARDEHPALVLHPPRGGVQQRQARACRLAHRGGDVPPRDRRKHLLDRQGRRLPALARPEQHHLQDGRPAPLRQQRRPEPAQPERSVATVGVSRSGSTMTIIDCHRR